MTIVANNSITVSNVNDGSITHVAWSWSADGTDGFTTVYPNLNLLSNSLFKNPIKTTSDSDSSFYGLQGNIVGSECIPSTSNRDLTISSRYVAGLGLPIGVYTSSITIANNSETVSKVEFILMTGTADTSINPYVNGVSVPWETAWSNPRVTINVPPKSKEVYTLTFTAKSTNNTGGGYIPQFLIFRETTANPVTRYSKPKLEQGSIATPWMPSASEVSANDYPRYRGEYSDFSSIASTDPSKYSWGLIRENTSYTHTAWSYNADGSDGFTTVYPNLNLLDGTKDFSGTWTNSYTWIWATDGTYKGLTVKKRTAQWSGIYKEFTAPKDGKYTFSTYVKSSGDTNIIRTVVINGVQKYSNWLGHDFDWNRDAITVDLKAGDVAFSRYESNTSNSNHILWVAGHKWEEGSVATLWMPSANEITTADYPSYRGEYSDFSSTASIDPSKYSWSPMRGSSSYTAYSWSADGADRFTTVYPNSNLLTSKPFVMGYGIPNTTWDATNKVSGISLPITVIKSEVLPQDPGFPFTYLPGVTYTQSIYISTDAPLTGTALIFTWYTNQYGHKTTGSNNLVKVSTNVYRAIGTYTFPSSNSPADGRNVDINNLTQVFDFTKGTFLQFYKPKLEEGSIATPYMISANEDPLGVIPKYVGTATLPYDSYDKYEWKINPDWINQFNINQQSEIINAQNAADKANNSISDMSKDSILTPIEKRKLLVDWTAIQSEYSKLIANANKFGVSTTAYASAYSVLSGYILSLISNLTVNSTIEANTFKTNFKNYYDAKVDLMNNTNLAIQANMDALGTNTAYSYSADGTDRFTTVYPNLNLLKGTKTPKSITGNNTVNQGGLLYSFDNNNTLANQGFSVNDTITLEFDWSATNPVSGQFTLQWNGQPWSFSVPTIKLSSTNGSGHVTHTFNIRDMDIASTAVATGIGYRFDNIPTNTVITFSNVIISKAKTSQLWMPSEKELTSDDIPKYVGYSVRQSENPKDFSWQPYGGLNSYNITKATTAIDQNSKEIALKANKLEVDTLSGRVLATESSLQIQDGKISALNTKTDGHTTQIGTLESSYSGLTSTISEIQTDVGGKAGKTELSQLSQDLSGFKTTVASTYADKVSVASQITQLSDNINLKVSKGDVVSQINVEAGQILFNSNKLVLNANTTEIAGDAFISGDMIVDGTIKGKQLDVEKLSSISNTLGEINGGSYSSWDIDDYDTPEGFDTLYRMTGIFMDRGRSRYLTVVTSILDPYTPMVNTSSIVRIEGNMQTGIGYRGIKLLSAELTTDYIGKTLDDILKTNILFIEDSDEMQLYDVETRIFHNDVGETSGLILGADQINIRGLHNSNVTNIDIYGNIDTYGTNGVSANGRSLSRRATIGKVIYYSTNWEFRRIGDIVYVDIPRQMRNYTAAQEEASVLTPEYIPSGFRPAYNHSFSVNCNVGTNVVNDTVFNMASSGQIKVTNTTTGNKIVQGSTSYITNDPFPS